MNKIGERSPYGMDQHPNYPTLTWHILEDGTQRTLCTGDYWRPPPRDKYPDMARELCVACRRESLNRMRGDE